MTSGRVTKTKLSTAKSNNCPNGISNKGFTNDSADDVYNGSAEDSSANNSSAGDSSAEDGSIKDDSDEDDFELDNKLTSSQKNNEMSNKDDNDIADTDDDSKQIPNVVHRKRLIKRCVEHTKAIKMYTQI